MTTTQTDRGFRMPDAIKVGHPPDGGERTISIRGDDPTVLAPQMTSTAPAACG